MNLSKARTARVLALLLAGAALASCMAHGQGRELDPKIYASFMPYSEAFYRQLMTGRVNLFAGTGRFRNVVQGQVFASDGTLMECSARRRLDNKLQWIGQSSTHWSLVKGGLGARIEWNYGGGLKKHAGKLYDPETGDFRTEVFRGSQLDSNPGQWRGSYFLSGPGQIQDSWPRALADACPGLKLPAHIQINEKQTSLRMDELRRQDPAAPIRHFPGSRMTAPGRTGLAASGGRPTTTRDEVSAFLHAQEGHVVTSPFGLGYVLVLAVGGSTHEIWSLANDGTIRAFGEVVEEGDWIAFKIPGDPDFERHFSGAAYRYPVGYPFAFLPTGHRHAAFQLTDELVGKGEPVALSWMGERYADHRFLFHDRTLTVVAPGETYLTGRWRWTKGHLQVWVDGEEQHAGSIAWRDLARELGVTPTVWTPDTPDRID